MVPPIQSAPNGARQEHEVAIASAVICSKHGYDLTADLSDLRMLCG